MDTIDNDIVLAMIDEPGAEMLNLVIGTLNSGETRAGVVADLYDGRGFSPRVPKADVQRWRQRLPSEQEVARVRSKIEAQGITVLNPASEHWPIGLDDLGSAMPRTLFVRGNPELLGRASIGVVGARAATGYGEHIAMNLTNDLVERGYAITSGGAYGIDGMAHRAALAAGGTTIAYMAGGVDRIYPMGNESLLTRVAETGVLVSEVEPGASPTKWRFLQRNRLIAATSKATLVVEAGFRSGSLNTVGHAAAMHRQVFAVPGPITSPASAGCHRVIADGTARLVTSASDIIEQIGAP